MQFVPSFRLHPQSAVGKPCSPPRPLPAHANGDLCQVRMVSHLITTELPGPDELIQMISMLQTKLQMCFLYCDLRAGLDRGLGHQVWKQFLTRLD